MKTESHRSGKTDSLTSELKKIRDSRKRSKLGSNQTGSRQVASTSTTFGRALGARQRMPKGYRRRA
jgi:hypothetical protein